MTHRGRIFASIAAVAAVAGALGTLAAASMMRSVAERKCTERMEAESALLAERLATLSVDSVTGQDLVERWSRLLRLRVALVGPDGATIADSTAGPAPPATGDSGPRPEIEDARTVGLGRHVRGSPATGEAHVHVARRVDSSEGLVVALDLSRAEARRAGPGAGGLVVTGLGLIVVLPLLLATAVSRWLARPLEALSRAAVAISEGHAEASLPVVADETVAGLAHAIDRLRARLVEQIERKERRQSMLDLLIDGLKEGILIVDAEQRVLAANNALRHNLTAAIDPVGRLQAEVFRHPDVIRSIEEALLTGEGVRCRVDDRPSTGKIFDLEVSPLMEDGTSRSRGAVALLYDVSRLETLESVRQKFVADVSHELRTPLTSIKAAVETLLDDAELDSAEVRRFLGIVLRHANRMETLVGDLSDLSKIETGAIELRRVTLDLAPVVQKTVEDLAARASARRVSVRTEIPTGFALEADPRRLEQILVNLVDNAIKFNHDGGVVTVRATMCEGRPRIEVEDTGIGIPSAAKEEVFHRFYRVDEARSRESGGTGLGLSIVKHLMQLHGGRVRVESELGSGSKFILEF